MAERQVGGWWPPVDNCPLPPQGRPTVAAQRCPHCPPSPPCLNCTCCTHGTHNAHTQHTRCTPCQISPTCPSCTCCTHTAHTLPKLHTLHTHYTHTAHCAKYPHHAQTAVHMLHTRHTVHTAHTIQTLASSSSLGDQPLLQGDPNRLSQMKFVYNILCFIDIWVNLRIHILQVLLGGLLFKTTLAIFRSKTKFLALSGPKKWGLCRR